MMRQTQIFAAIAIATGIALVDLPCALAEEGNVPAISMNQAGEEQKRAGHDQKQNVQGWQPEYGGFRRTPILFDPIRDKDGDGELSADEKKRRARVYPELSISGLGHEGILNDLSVDDEVYKTELPFFQPVSVIQGSFAADKKSRDRYLNLFNSIRGIAVLTLSYLDKTVAAGLSTAQQQSDMNAVQEFLKQISVTNAKIANRSQSQVYNDWQEKFMGCMLEIQADASQPKPEHIQIDECSDECAEIAEKAKETAYHYCVCCAEKSTEVNLATNVNAARDKHVKAKEGWSLVNRAFLGLKWNNQTLEVFNDPDNNDRKDEMETYAAYFRALYGDVVYRRDDNGIQRIRYLTPFRSVAQWIETFRDPKQVATDLKGCGTELYEDSGDNVPYEVRYCPITMEVLDKGICESFKDILYLEKYGKIDKILNGSAQTGRDNASVNKTQLEKLWLEASLGGMFTRADVANFAGKHLETLATERERLLVETFCDTAAVAALKKVHYRMMSIALDHMLLNRKLSEYDRGLLASLMNRVTNYFELGAKDARSPIDSMLLAAGVEADRRFEAARGAVMSSWAASHARTQELGDISPMGGR